MNFSSNTTLTQRAGISVLSSIWNQQDVIQGIKILISGNVNPETCKNVENNVISMLYKTLLPNTLKSMLLDLVQPMGVEVCKWLNLTYPAFHISSNLPDTLIFIWTDRGVIDHCKTAEVIIKSSSDKILCFCLACIFCIEETIFSLWPDVGSIMYQKVRTEFSIVECNPVIYWTYNLHGNIEFLMSLTECGVKNSYEFGFLYILNSKCVSSLKYFLKFVEPERRKKLIFLALREIFNIAMLRDGNVLIFLFSHLTEYDINQAIQENCLCVLSSFLDWPCQEFFIPLANSSWNHLSNINYLVLFDNLVKTVSICYLSDTYKTLFKQFYESSPPAFKKYIKAKCTSGSFLSRLFLYENTHEIIQTFLNDFSSDEKQQMIFYYESMNLCDTLVKKERWNYLQLLVKNCIHDQSTLKEFMKQYGQSKYFICDPNRASRTSILFEKLKEWYNVDSDSE